MFVSQTNSAPALLELKTTLFLSVYGDYELRRPDLTSLVYCSYHDNYHFFQLLFPLPFAEWVSCFALQLLQDGLKQPVICPTGQGHSCPFKAVKKH